MSFPRFLPSPKPGPPLRYKVSADRLTDSALRESFVELEQDDETRAFLREHKVTNFGISFALHHFLARLAKCCCSFTDVDGCLGIHIMFVLSTSQARQLLSVGNGYMLHAGQKFKALLDVGAGTGAVTAQLAPLAERVVVTELSPSMIQRLKARGYECVVTPTLSASSLPLRLFDLISCLNVLDRADRPMSLLREMRSLLTPNTGRLILAVVLPFSPFVEGGGGGASKPSEELCMHGGRRGDDGVTFESAVQCLVNRVLQPLGFKVHVWTRLPYLCAGNTRRTHYALNDALFILSVP